MFYYIYYLYKYSYYIYYMGICYYGLRVSYDTYNCVNYVYNLIPYRENNQNNVNIEMYEIEKNEDWNIIKLI